MGFEIIGMIFAGASIGLLSFYMAKGIVDIFMGKMR